MRPGFIIGFALFFAAILINRSITSAALKKLDDETKLRLVNAFSDGGGIKSIVLFVIVIGYVLALQVYPQHIGMLTIGYAVLFGAYLLWKFTANYRKLKEIDVPREYFRSFYLGWAIFTLGVASLAIVYIY